MALPVAKYDSQPPEATAVVSSFIGDRNNYCILVTVWTKTHLVTETTSCTGTMVVSCKPGSDRGILQARPWYLASQAVVSCKPGRGRAARQGLNFDYNDRRKKFIPNKVQTKYALGHRTILWNLLPCRHNQRFSPRTHFCGFMLGHLGVV